MTNNLITFNFQNNKIRTEIKDNEPWFCLMDCCKALELKSPKDAVKQLKQKGATLTRTLTNGGIQKLIFINEPNLYRLVFRSRKPQAQAFADWVYSEVLPSIRKTGGYGAPAPVDMKAIGGVVKKCAAVAVRDELKAVIHDEFEYFVMRTFAAAKDLKPFQQVTETCCCAGFMTGIRPSTMNI